MRDVQRFLQMMAREEPGMLLDSLQQAQAIVEKIDASPNPAAVFADLQRQEAAMLQHLQSELASGGSVDNLGLVPGGRQLHSNKRHPPANNLRLRSNENAPTASTIASMATPDRRNAATVHLPSGPPSTGSPGAGAAGSAGSTGGSVPVPPDVISALTGLPVNFGGASAEYAAVVSSESLAQQQKQGADKPSTKVKELCLQPPAASEQWETIGGVLPGGLPSEEQQRQAPLYISRDAAALADLVRSLPPGSPVPARLVRGLVVWQDGALSKAVAGGQFIGPFLHANTTQLVMDHLSGKAPASEEATSSSKAAPASQSSTKGIKNDTLWARILRSAGGEYAALAEFPAVYARPATKDTKDKKK
jgi:hypothetical protein